MSEPIVSQQGECRIYRVHHEVLMKNPYDATKLIGILDLYSKFCLGKTIRKPIHFNSGGYGNIYTVEIDGAKYAVKKQTCLLSHSLEKMEKEVSISNSLLDIRRRDGQRIGIPIFDCFFLCKLYIGNFCHGEMYYIMELGEGSVDSIFKKRDGLFANILVKKTILRDVMIKMLENIVLLTAERGFVNLDLKPGNSIYNFKKINGMTRACPMFIDMDDKFCIHDFESLVDRTKLNSLLRRLKIDGQVLRTKNIGDLEFSKIVIVISSLSYVNFSLICLRKDVSYSDFVEILKDVFLLPKRDDEPISISNLFSSFLLPEQQEKWLQVTIILLLSTNILDSRSTSKMRRNFYHYNAHGIYDKERAFRIFKNDIKNNYVRGKTLRGESGETIFPELNMDECRRLSNLGTDEFEDNDWNTLEEDNIVEHSTALRDMRRGRSVFDRLRSAFQ